MVGFAPGYVVRLVGLRNGAYNGKIAEVESKLDEESGRHWVEVLADELDGAADALLRHIRVKPANMVHACAQCHASEVAKMMICGKCKTARYCNVACQREAWPQHKEGCVQLGIGRDVAKVPLVDACIRGDVAEVRRLVELGANVTRPTWVATLF
jgi:hypothetical protein